MSSNCHTKSVLFTEEGECVYIQNFKRLRKTSFIIYGDNEWALVPSTDNIDFGKKYH